MTFSSFPRERQKFWTPRTITGVSLAVGFVAIIIIAVAISVANDEPNEPPEYVPSPGVAARECEKQVEKLLKAPATANFDLTAVADPGAGFVVTGTVDAQNSFGAMIRNDVKCSVRFEGPISYTRVDYIQ